MRKIYPGLPLCVVSEFPPAGADRWMRYNANRRFVITWRAAVQRSAADPSVSQR